MKIGARRWKRLGIIGAAPPHPLDSRFRGNDELRGRNDENAEWRGSTARSKAA